MRLLVALILLGALIPLALTSSANAEAVFADPSLCRVDPRSEAEVAELLEREPSERTEFEMDTVIREATHEEMTALTDVVIEFMACINAGDQLRAMALVSDDMISGSMVNVAEPGSANESGVWVEGLYAGYLFPDGRLGAVVVTSIEGMIPPLLSNFLFFKLVDDRWILDDLPPSGFTIQVPGETEEVPT